MTIRTQSDFYAVFPCLFIYTYSTVLTYCSLDSGGILYLVENTLPPSSYFSFLFFLQMERKIKQIVLYSELKKVVNGQVLTSAGP